MTVIPIKGTIIPNNAKYFYDLYDIEATCPKDISLPETGEAIEVHINSGGGSVFAGSEIYTAIKSYPGQVTVKIVGLAASAASVIAMAGDTIEMSPTSQMMIHNASSGNHGDYRSMAQESSILSGLNESIASAYMMKTGKAKDDLLDLMNKETWFTAEKAVEAGFADKVMFQDEGYVVPEFVASVSTVIPQGLIDDLINKEKAATAESKVFEAIHDRLDQFESVLESLKGSLSVAKEPSATEPKVVSPFSQFL